jgi:hypothetical protein
MFGSPMEAAMVPTPTGPAAELFEHGEHDLAVDFVEAVGARLRGG